MNRVSVTGVLGALLFLTPACSEANSAAGIYAVDITPTIDGIIASRSVDVELPPEARTFIQTNFSKLFEKTTFELKNDQTFTGTQENPEGETSTATGIWSEAAGTITISTTHEDGEEKTSTQTGTYKDGILILEAEQDGQKMRLHLKKKDS